MVWTGEFFRSFVINFGPTSAPSKNERRLWVPRIVPERLGRYQRASARLTNSTCHAVIRGRGPYNVRVHPHVWRLDFFACGESWQIRGGRGVNFAAHGRQAFRSTLFDCESQNERGGAFASINIDLLRPLE